MMLYLYEQYGSGSTDWTQPSGVYRSGSYLYLNNGKNNYNYYYEPSVEPSTDATEDSSSSSSSNSEENSEHTEPSAKENEQNR